MIVLVLTACPVGLRGHLTRWLMEVSPGVFVGRLNPRLRDHVWELVTEEVRGSALLVFQDRSTEQGFGFRTNENEWQPHDVEGATLIMRPTARSKMGGRRGWSSASRYRRAARGRAGKGR